MDNFFVLYFFSILIPYIWYFVEVKPHVDAEINSFAESISDVNDPWVRIKEVANFTEKDYYQAYGKNSSFSLFGVYVFDDPDKLRTRSGGSGHLQKND